MLSLDEYLSKTNTSRRTFFNHRDAGKILTIKVNGKLFILDKSESLNLSNKQRRQIIAAFKERLDEMIQTADPMNKAAMVKRIESLVATLKAHGIVIKGYNKKSIYRKIHLAKLYGKLQRKTRSDKFSIRNELLNSSFQKIKELAAAVYFRNAQPNLNLTVDLILEHAKRNEKYYEIAAIPKSSLYRQLSLDFEQSGFKTLHQYMNHYNKFSQTLPTVTGAFTDDIKFMQFICGDDHKCDVAAVKVYNKLTGKVEEKQVKIWFWNEAKTMYPLGWVIKVGDFTTHDLITSLIDVLFQYGLPTDNILIDNGIGRSEEFKNFWRKIALKEPNYSAAYTPTNKATIERTFGIFKSEFDSFQKNYVSPHKEDARHTTAALSPEAAELFFDEYKKKLEAYIMGFFIERPRIRIIEGKRRRINIKDYFNGLLLTHRKQEVLPQQVRYALSSTQVKTYQNGIKLGTEFYHSADILPVSFNGQEFIVFTNPNDDSEIDLYALNDILIRETGEFYQKNSYITTLYNTRMTADKKSLVMQQRKKINKLLKKMSEEITALQQIEHPLPDTVTPNGELLKERDELQKRNQSLLRERISTLPTGALPLATNDERNPEEEEHEYSLTYDSSINNSKE
jgi:hypothetical protein